MTKEDLIKLNAPTNNIGYIDLFKTNPIELISNYSKETNKLELEYKEIIRKRREQSKDLFINICTFLINAHLSAIKNLELTKDPNKNRYISAHKVRIKNYESLIQEVYKAMNKQYDKSIDDVLQIC